MNYDIKITKDAKNDLRNINYYLKIKFEGTQVAHDIMIKIKNAIKSLSYFPERCPIVKDSFLKTKNIRKCVINNYIIFYIVESNKKMVHIIRVSYAKSNWMKQI